MKLVIQYSKHFLTFAVYFAEGIMPEMVGKSQKSKLLIASLIINFFFIGFVFCPASSRTLFETDKIGAHAAKISSDNPHVDFKIHNVGRIGLTVTNIGSFGTGFIGEQADETTGQAAPSGIYPYPGRLKYLFAGAFWIGAVVRRDTLVSVGADGWHYTREMWPDPFPKGQIESHSIFDEDDKDAVSEEDFIAIYTDTVTNPSYVDNDPILHRPHIPLNMEITQRSYAWSYEYAEDFVLFDYSIKNIGRDRLNQVYMAVYLDAECRRLGGQPDEFKDDISGFRRTVDSPIGCGFIDTVNIAWVADNDGRHTENETCPNQFEMTSVAGIKVVRTPSDSLDYSFNWWISNPDASLDFGPRKAGTAEYPFRDFGGFLGTPEGDLNKYYIMRHEEFDYDQLFCAKDNTADGWLPPGQDAINFADGFDTRFLLSFGPFDIDPGEVLPVSFAYVLGENFHYNCEAFERLFRPNSSQPDAYYRQLDFSDLGLNAMWASWIYDNPGYDTDGDGYSGKFRVCAQDSSIVLDTIAVEPDIVIETTVVYLLADTIWYEGDGVPDFRGASPPPPPDLRVYPRIDKFNMGEICIRWNGFESETARDVFSNMIDFEGYRVYYSLSDQTSDYVLLTSYDKKDYNKFVWNQVRGLWELHDPPFTIDSLVKLYPGIGENPHEIYYRENPYIYMDSLFYFAPQDYNQSDLRDKNLIHKIYTEQPPPTIPNLDSAKLYYPEELTEKGLFKYYEYEYTITNLLPSQLYYVTVTAFDFGSPKSGLPCLESAFNLNTVATYPQNINSLVEDKGLDVIVYPNPYRIDADYRELGFEARGREDLANDRARAIHFFNLPNKCTIRIFTVDGDLVREIKHNCPYDSPECMHEKWDMITRNTQIPTSGIYYWVIESESRTQIGKLVIIM